MMHIYMCAHFAGKLEDISLFSAAICTQQSFGRRFIYQRGSEVRFGVEDSGQKIGDIERLLFIFFYLQMEYRNL